MADEKTTAPAQPGIMDRLASLRAVHESGGDLLTAAAGAQPEPKPTAAEPPDPPAKPQAQPAAEGETHEETPEPVEEESQLDKLRELFKEQNTSADGDPKGTYRDELGRLRDEVTHKFLAEPEPKPADPPTEGEAPAGDEASGDELIVKLPGREPGTEYEYKASSKEEAERLRQTANGAMRRAEFHAAMEQVETQRSEIEYIYAQLEQRPADFLLEAVAPDTRAAVARALLAELPEAEFKALVDEIDAYAVDPNARNLAALREREARRTRGDKAADSFTREQRATENARKLAGAIQSVIPETFANDDAALFYDTAVVALRRHVKANPGTKLTPDSVPGLLQELGVMKRFGVEDPGAEPPKKQKQPAAKAARQRSPAPATPPAAHKIGERLTQESQRRSAAAATAPAGAGDGSSGLRPPAGQGVTERLKWARKSLLGGR